MRFIALIFTALFLTMPAVLSEAHAQENLKVAVIDINRLQAEAKAAVDIRNQVESLRKTYISTLEKEEAALRKEEKALMEQQGSMKEEEFRKKAEAFRSELVKKSKAMQEKQAELDKAVGDALMKLRDEIIKITDDVAKENSYTLVMPRQSVFYFDKSYNITDDVLKKLDARVKSIKINAR